MMKRTLLGACAALLLLAGGAQAQTVSMDGITYTVDAEAGTASVTGADAGITTARVLASVEYEGVDYPVTDISDFAFYRCEALASVTLPEGVEAIGAQAFDMCAALASVTLPKGLETIEVMAFDCCTSLRSINLPEGLATIGNMAFAYCESLSEVTFPYGMATIDSQAFQYCTSLQSITLPDGLEEIDGWAFQYCPLTEVTVLAATPPSIYADTFDGGTYAEATFCVPAIAADRYAADEEWGSFQRQETFEYHYDADPSTRTATLVRYGGTGVAAIVPATARVDDADYAVTAIGRRAFAECTALESVTLPESLQEIGEEAFADCPLAGITSNAATPPSIHENTFSYATYTAAELHLPEGAEEAYRAAEGWDLFYTSTAEGGMAFTCYPETLTAAVTAYTGEEADLVVPATVAIDGTEYTVAVIGDDVFAGNAALRSVTLPATVAAIGARAFRECAALESVVMAGGAATAGAGAGRIGEQAFYACTALARIDLPGGLAEIGPEAFFGCMVLPGINLPEGLAKIGDMAFCYCAALESITLPESLTSIGYAAFQVCTSLESVTLPDGLAEIGEGAFYYCTALSAIDLPEGLTEIGNITFADCTALAAVTLPSALARIGYDAFAGCTSLESITLPDGLAEIGSAAFAGCPLAEVTCKAAIPPVVEGDTFDASTCAEATLHVPADAVEDYQAAEGWKQFLRIEGNLPPVSVGSVAAGESLATYANGIVTIESPATITVYAQSGARVRHAAGVASLSLEGLPSGIYIICVKAGGKTQVLKAAR